ncbi:TRAP transporter small permease subunit [Rhodobacterales bacterium HKCCE2091]|nr:TRAP transporter small permease subunit [Rhodobacterales bacterium HKCCE2091]
MRAVLDRIYSAALAVSALALVLIAVLVFLQIGGRVFDRVVTWAGGSAVGFSIPSLAEIGGFLFAAAAFLALPATLRAAGHVRVAMLRKALPAPLAHGVTILVLFAAFGLACFAAWHAWLQTLDSWQFNSQSFGMIAIPLWIPQGAMTLGLAIFAVAILDEIAAALRGTDPAFIRAEAERSIEDGGH